MFTLNSCCCLISQNQIDSLAISFNFKKLKITSLCPIPINSNSNSNALDLMLIVTRLYIKMQHINALSGLGIRMIFFLRLRLLIFSNGYGSITIFYKSKHFFLMVLLFYISSSFTILFSGDKNILLNLTNSQSQGWCMNRCRSRSRLREKNQ